MEIAIALVKLGVEVAVIERSPVLLPYLEAASLSAYVRGYAEKLGISVLLNDTAAALHGQDKVQAVETTSGRRNNARTWSSWPAAWVSPRSALPFTASWPIAAFTAVSPSSLAATTQ